MFILSCINIFAQSSRTSSTHEDETTPVVELNSFLAPPSGQLRAASSSAVNQINQQNVRDLIFNNQPSIYYYSGVEKTYGEKPKHLFTDLNSLGNLANAISLKNNIEIVTIKLNNVSQLNSVVNLADLSSFKNLKYIYFVTNFETTSEAISAMISGDSEKYMVLYKIAKGDSNQ